MAKAKNYAESMKEVVKMRREASQLEKKAMREMDSERKQTLRNVSGVVERIYESNDPVYVELFLGFVKALDRSSKSDVFRKRIKGATAYLQAGEQYRRDQKKNAEASGEIKLGNQASQYLNDLDRKAGIRNRPTLGGYRQRIEGCIRAGEIEARGVSARKRMVSFEELKKVHEMYLPD